MTDAYFFVVWGREMFTISTAIVIRRSIKRSRGNLRLLGTTFKPAH